MKVEHRMENDVKIRTGGAQCKRGGKASARLALSLAAAAALCMSFGMADAAEYAKTINGAENDYASLVTTDGSGVRTYTFTKGDTLKTSGSAIDINKNGAKEIKIQNLAGIDTGVSSASKVYGIYMSSDVEKQKLETDTAQITVSGERTGAIDAAGVLLSAKESTLTLTAEETALTISAKANTGQAVANGICIPYSSKAMTDSVTANTLHVTSTAQTNGQADAFGVNLSAGTITFAGGSLKADALVVNGGGSSATATGLVSSGATAGHAKVNVTGDVALEAEAEKRSGTEDKGTATARGIYTSGGGEVVMQGGSIKAESESAVTAASAVGIRANTGAVTAEGTLTSIEAKATGQGYVRAEGIDVIKNGAVTLSKGVTQLKATAGSTDEAPLSYEQVAAYGITAKGALVIQGDTAIQAESSATETKALARGVYTEYSGSVQMGGGTVSAKATSTGSSAEAGGLFSWQNTTDGLTLTSQVNVTAEAVGGTKASSYGAYVKNDGGRISLQGGSIKTKAESTDNEANAYGICEQTGGIFASEKALAIEAKATGKTSANSYGICAWYKSSTSETVPVNITIAGGTVYAEAESASGNSNAYGISLFQSRAEIQTAKIEAVSKATGENSTVYAYGTNILADGEGAITAGKITASAENQGSGDTWAIAVRTLGKAVIDGTPTISANAVAKQAAHARGAQIFNGGTAEINSGTINTKAESTEASAEAEGLYVFANSSPSSITSEGVLNISSSAKGKTGATSYGEYVSGASTIETKGGTIETKAESSDGSSSARGFYASGVGTMLTATGAVKVTAEAKGKDSARADGVNAISGGSIHMQGGSLSAFSESSAGNADARGISAYSGGTVTAAEKLDTVSASAKVTGGAGNAYASGLGIVKNQNGNGAESITLVNGADITANAVNEGSGAVYSYGIGTAGKVDVHGDASVSASGEAKSTDGGEVIGLMAESKTGILTMDGEKLSVSAASESLGERTYGVYARNLGKLLLGGESTEQLSLSAGKGGTVLAAAGGGTVTAAADTVSSTDAAEMLLSAEGTASSASLTVRKSGTLYGAALAKECGTGTITLSGTSEWTGSAYRDAASELSVALADTAAWHVAPSAAASDGVSDISSLAVNGGTVDLASHAEYQKLSAGTLSGDGAVFLLKAGIEEDAADQVDIGSGSGSHSVYVNPTGTEGTAEEMAAYLVKAHEGSADFSLLNTVTIQGEAAHRVEQSLYFYELADRINADDETEWYLKRAEETPAGETEAALSGLAGNYALWHSFQTDLRKRMGEMRYEGEGGVWARGFTDRSKLDGLGRAGFSQKMSGVSVGYDRAARDTAGGTWFVGAALRTAHASQHVRGLWGGRGTLDSTGLAFYATQMRNDGWYFDGVLTADWYKHKIRATMTDGTAMRDERHSYGLGASAEIGKKIALGGDGWFIEPQGEIAYFYVKGGDYTASNGVTVEQKSLDSLTGRLGIVLGRKLAGEGSRYVEPYVKAGVSHEFLGDEEARLNGTIFTGDLGGTYWYWGVGIDWQAAEDFRLYAQAEREEGSHYTREYNISLGLRLSF